MFQTPELVSGQTYSSYGPGRNSVCSLRLSYALCHDGVIDAVITGLETTKIASFQETPALRGQLVLALDDDRCAVLHGFRLTYDLERGLVHERL